MSSLSLLNSLEGTWEATKGRLAQNLQHIQESVNELISSNGLDAINDSWVLVPYISTNFTTNTAGAITPQLAQPYAIAYKVIGKMMWLNANFSAAITNAATTELRMAIPRGFTPKTIPSVGVLTENRMRGSGVWDNGAIAGVIRVSINITNRYVVAQRWDGAPATAFPNATTCVVGYMIQIPLA